MNRKQKIIVSVVAILIVTLALVGITYAYFLTQIQGNTNTKSIEVSTANLVVDYGEDTNVIQTKTGLTPGNVAVTKTFSATNHGSDEAGYVAILRDVTYKNTRDNSSINGFERQQDLTYTLTCKQFNEINVETGTCDGVTDYIFPQSTDVSIMVSNKIPVGYTHKYTLTINYLEAGVDQSHDMAKSFSAKVDIEDIKRLNNPYDTGVSPENNKSLAYNIIQNATINKNGTSLVSSPLTKPAEEISSSWSSGNFDIESISTDSLCANYHSWLIGDTLEDAKQSGTNVSSYTDAIGKYIYDQCSGWVKYLDSYDSSTNTLVFKNYEIDQFEKELSVTQDDYGISYYFRGKVSDNYLNFAGMCWRIVRIEGDGSTKLILEDSAHECNSSEYTENWTIGGTVAFGSDNNGRADFLNYTGGLADNLVTYQSTLTTKVSNTYTGKTIIDYLKADEWCFDDNVTETDEYNNEYYGAHTRIYIDKKPSLKCSGTKLTSFKDNTPMYVGTLTADEISFAGGGILTNYGYYLLNSYANTNSLNWWTLSLIGFDVWDVSDRAFYVHDHGYLSNDNVADNLFVARGAVTLKSNIEILTGDGTKNNPYTLK